MKTLISIATATAMFICFSAAPARADRKTTEGFLLGIGAAVLGTAIYQSLDRDPGYRAPQRHHGPPSFERGSQCREDRWHVKRHGRPLKIERIWVAPVYETRWNPGHYNRKGHWVGGRYETFKVRDGYWEERRVRGRY